MSIENKVQAYRELAKKIEALEEQKRQLSQEILQLMPQEVQVMRVLEFQVKRMSKLSIKTSLEVAKAFGAAKIQEVVDKEKIKQLVQQGLSIPDVSEIQFIQVSTLRKKE